MTIILTEEQKESIAFAYIKESQKSSDGYKKVIEMLFSGCHFAKWSWLDALRFACQVCSKNYFSDMSWIKEQL